jgi:hypothetical protein
MFIKTNFIKLDNIEDNALYIKYTCSLCNRDNIFTFEDFDTDFFKRKIGFEIKNIEHCPNCDYISRHLIILKSDNENLYIEVKDEKVSYEYRRKQELELFISTDYEEYNGEILLELDYYDLEVGNEIFRRAKQSLYDIEKEIKTNVNLSRIIINSLYSTCISVFEAFLSELFITTCLHNEKVLKRLITDTDIYKDEKINIKDFFSFQQTLKTNTIKKLQETTFHNINIVCAYYKTCINVDISKYLKSIPSSINIRHDIVHRNGKTKNDENIDITKENIIDLIQDIENCIKAINIDFERENLELGNKGGFKDYNNFTSPFLDYNSFE